MRKNIVLLTTVSLLSLASCKPVLLKLYGIKDPEIENERGIKRKALKFNLDTGNIVSVNSADFLKELSKQGIPEAAVYDREGRYIEYRQTDTSCNAGLFKFIPELDPAAEYRMPDSLTLSSEFKKFRDLKGRIIPAPEGADFYLLIYWTVWTGKLNKDHVKIWEDQALQNKKAKIKVVKVNLDIQEYYEEKEKQRILKAISKKRK